MNASDIVNEVAESLNDEAHVTWSESDLLTYIGAGEEQIVTLRPDAFSETTTMQLAAGTKQSIPATARRLLDITRNMGTDGQTPGRVVNTVEKNVLDLFSFDWHEDDQSAVSLDYCYDERDPDVFYVDPPSDGTGYVEIIISKTPPTPGINDSLSVKSIYRNALIQWCMYRAYAKEVDSVSSQTRARTHEASFYTLMGAKFQKDATYSPSPEVNAGGN